MDIAAVSVTVKTMFIKVLSEDDEIRFRHPPPSVWRPMKTAPRDRTEVLLCMREGIVSAWFEPPAIVHSYFDGDEQVGSEWVCFDDKFTEIVEWFGKNDYGDGAAGILGWMPMPEKPSHEDTDV